MKFKVEENAAEIALLELYATLGDWRRKSLEALEVLRESNDSTDIIKIVDYTIFATVINVCEHACALVEKEVDNIIEEVAAREGL